MKKLTDYDFGMDMDELTDLIDEAVNTNIEESVNTEEAIEGIKEEKVEVREAAGKVVGKLEVDMNFAMPLANASDLGISLNLKDSNNNIIIVYPIINFLFFLWYLTMEHKGQGSLH